MPHVIPANDKVVIQFSFWEKFSSLHGDFTLKKSDILSVTSTKPQASWKELRLPGTFFPGLIKAGTYFTKRGKEFWYITRSSRFPLTIAVKNMSYQRIIIGFPSEFERDTAYRMMQ